MVRCSPSASPHVSNCLRVRRSFAQYRVPDSSQTIVAFGEEKNSIIGTISRCLSTLAHHRARVAVVSADGVFYKAHFDPDKPGSCFAVLDLISRVYFQSQARNVCNSSSPNSSKTLPRRPQRASLERSCRLPPLRFCLLSFCESRRLPEQTLAFSLRVPSSSARLPRWRLYS